MKRAASVLTLAALTPVLVWIALAWFPSGDRPGRTANDGNNSASGSGALTAAAPQEEDEKKSQDDPAECSVLRLSLAGRVRDTEGNTIAGARVRVAWTIGVPSRLQDMYGGICLDPFEKREPPPFKTEGCTDSQGHFAFSDLAPGDIEVLIEAEGKYPTSLIAYLPWPDQMEVILRRPVVISGKVLVGEKHLPGVLVEASAEMLIGTTMTASDGSYRLEVAPGIRVKLRASTSGRENIEKRIPSALEEGEEREVDFDFPCGGTIAGLVLEHDSRPAAGARVTLHKLGDCREVLLTADRAGKFNYKGLLPGAYLVDAESDEGSTMNPDVEGRNANREGVQARKVVVRPPGSKETVQLHLVQFAKLEGKVMDMEDRPVAGAILMIGIDLDSGRHSFENTSGRSGEFSARVWPALEYQIGILAPRLLGGGSWSPKRFPGLGPGEKSDECIIRSERPSEVEILVVDEEGSPVAGASVTGTTRHFMFASSSNEPAYGYFEANRTGPDGRIVGDAWPWVRYRFEVDAWGFETYVLDLDVPEGAERHEEKVVLNRGRRGFIYGEVVGEDGKPIEGVSMEAQERRPPVAVDGDPILFLAAVDDRSRPLFASTDGSGKFRMGGIGEGECTVNAVAEGFIPSEKLNIHADGNPLRLVLKRAPEIRGTVALETGEPVAGAMVEAGGAREETDENGAFRLFLKVTDAKEISIQGEEIYPETYDLSSFSNGPLHLEVRPREIFEGRAVDGDGNAVRFAFLEALKINLETTEKIEIRTDHEGRFRFRWNLIGPPPSGGTHLYIHVPDFLRREFLAIDVPSFTFSSGENILIFPKGLQTSVLVIDEEGKALEGARVRVDGILGPSFFITGADGRAMIGPLPYRRIDVEVKRLNHGSVNAEIDPEAPENVIRLPMNGVGPGNHMSPPPSPQPSEAE